MTHDLDRRTFLRQAAVLGGGALVAPSLLGLSACSRGVGPVPRGPGYGPLLPSADVPELWIPEGFTARKLSTTRAPSTVNPGLTVRYGVDGMAAFEAEDGRVRLVRNHEVRDPATTAQLLGPGARAYDRKAGGGTSTLEVRQARDGSVELEREFVSLSGTHTNCAGGPTPWGSWITCEETTVGPAAGYERAHGYCFEVPASANEEVEPVPLRAMGRFVHEAMAVDPRSGHVYLTEDVSYDPAIAAGRGAGFYRFLPAQPGNLAAGGRLQMLAVRGRPQYVTVHGQTVGAQLRAEWVDIDDPDPAGAEGNLSAVFQQGWARGGAVFQRLEGCWYGEGNVYFNATSGGNAAAGQVWSYRPDGDDDGTLTLIFESPSRDVLDSPDNLCVSPRGGLVLCEDSAGEQFLRGLTPEGQIFDFIRTAGVSAETAGACFSPDGKTLFFNIQGGTSAATTLAGGTYAIWGPWEKGAL
ncbi:MAG TPA: alkaline phosphatase PhoX [Longimicrobium sp.]|nr:alkaline phosphatase PhoX [Longimicrobium sp.]